MSICFYPRLSQATNLLPVLRAQLAAAASRHLLPDGFSCDLLPIVEDGIFGYEFLPQRQTHTYLTLGCDSSGQPVLRKSLYCAAAPCALRLAATNGRVLTQGELVAWHCIQPRDFPFPDWTTAAEAAWHDFSALFPEGPRRAVEIHDARHRSLDQALAIAHSLLAHCDPSIDFCGVPDEAQYGIALTGANGESGQLMARTAGDWTLRWEATGKALHEHWAGAAREDVDGSAWACAGTSPGGPPLRRLPFGATDSGVTPRQR